MVIRSLCAFCVCMSVALCDERQPELDVPFEPTHPEVVEAMLKLAGVTAKDTLYDLGCGDGRIVIMAAQKYGARAIGIDIDPQRIKEAKENAKYAGVSSQTTFRQEDIKETDLTGATAVTLYLLDSVNLLVRPKLFRDLEPGARIVSHAFSMGDWESDKTVTHEKARGDVVYYWVIPAAAGGKWKWVEGKTTHSLHLEQNFQELTGAFSSPRFGTHAIRHGTLAGRQLTVTLIIPIDKQSVKVVLQGVVRGDSLEGTQVWNGGPRPGKREWRAARTPTELAGEWRVRIKESDKKLDGTLRIVRKNGKWKGSYVRKEEPSKSEAVALYVWGASLRFEVPFEDEPVAFTGFFESDSASGKMDDTVSWSARRVTPRK